MKPRHFFAIRISKAVRGCCIASSWLVADIYWNFENLGALEKDMSYENVKLQLFYVPGARLSKNEVYTRPIYA